MLLIPPVSSIPLSVFSVPSVLSLSLRLVLSVTVVSISEVSVLLLRVASEPLPVQSIPVSSIAGPRTRIRYQDQEPGSSTFLIKCQMSNDKSQMTKVK